MIIAAGLRKKERLPPYEGYLDELDRETRKLEELDIMTQPVLIDVPRMLDWTESQ